MSLSLLRSYQEVDFTTLRSRLNTKVQGIPKPIVDDVLSEILDEFCTDSLFWREEMILYPTMGFSEYPIPNLGNTRFIELISARMQDGSPLKLGVDCWMVGLDALGVSDDVLTEGKPIIVLIAVAPAVGVRLMSKNIADYCSDWVTDGAAARLMAMPPENPWSNYDQAKMFSDQFARGKRKARRMALNKFTSHHNPTRKHEFY